MSFKPPSEDDLPENKQAKLMREILQPFSASAAEEVARRVKGTVTSIPETAAQRLKASTGVDLSNLPGTASKDLHAELISTFSQQAVRESTMEQLQKLDTDRFRREREHWQRQQDREEEKLELQRRAVAASEAALEEERERTKQAKADAEEARKDARTARSHMRISLWFAGASFLAAVWALLKDQF